MFPNNQEQVLAMLQYQHQPLHIKEIHRYLEFYLGQHEDIKLKEKNHKAGRTQVPLWADDKRVIWAAISILQCFSISYIGAAIS